MISKNPFRIDFEIVLPDSDFLRQFSDGTSGQQFFSHLFDLFIMAGLECVT